MPGIKGSAERGTVYLPDLLNVMICVGDFNKQSLSVTMHDSGDVYLHGLLRL